MRVLVVGASGATGKLVVMQLLERKIAVRIVVREASTLPPQLFDNPMVEIVKGSIDSFSQQQVQLLLQDCEAAVCCLGHTMSVKGIFGKPYKLVLHAVQKVTTAMNTFAKSQQFILMSTTAYTNKKDGEKNTLGESVLFALLKILLPPHRDNVLAANYLEYRLGESTAFSWVAVRPDTLFNEEHPSTYEVVDHIKRSPVFDAGKTSRINVACFMAELLTDDGLWQQWKYKTPVIYNTLS
jgi:nucleoside-diphosphate-sugar epimerase